jgi:hypothetical protein
MSSPFMVAKTRVGETWIQAGPYWARRDSTVLALGGQSILRARFALLGRLIPQFVYAG